MKHGYESMEDMRRMQQEAILRVREMQKRAKISLDSQPQIAPGNNTKNCEPEKQTHSNSIQNAPASFQNGFPNNFLPKNNIFEIFFKDSEKSLILILVLLLIEENSDMGLILALMYLMI